MASRRRQEKVYPVLGVNFVWKCVCTVVLMASTWPGSMAARDRVTDPSDSTKQWVAAHRSWVVDRVLTQPTPNEAVALDTEWVAIIRVSPNDSQQDELLIRVSKPYVGDATASVTRPCGGSIQAQMAALKFADPRLSPNEASALVQVHTIDVSRSHQREISHFVNGLEATRGQYVFSNALMADATRYEVWTFGGPQQLYVTLMGPDSGHPTLPLLKILLQIRSVAYHATERKAR